MRSRLVGPEEVSVALVDARPGDVDRLLAEVARSTAAKAAEIVALRESLVATLGQRLADCAGRLGEAFQGGGKLFSFGNGGSSTDAQEIAQLFLHPPAGRPLPAISLTHDVAILTALSNDVGFEVVFARQPRRPPGGAWSRWGWPGTTAGGWRRPTPSTTCSPYPRRRCTGCRRRRRRSTTCSGSSPSRTSSANSEQAVVVSTVERVRVRVEGIVQGVGFRPFVHGLANRYGLAGFVGNDTEGVFVEAEGARATLAAFVADLSARPPALAQVDRQGSGKVAICPVGGLRVRRS